VAAWAPPSADDGAYPVPAGAVPPSAEQISSFLRHVRRQATDGATATATSAAAVLTVPLSPDVTEGDATATAGSPADTGLGVDTYPAHITGNKNNPAGLAGTTPMGPDDTLIANSGTAASPTLEETTASAIDTGPNDDTRIADSDTAASPTLKRPGPQTTNEPEPPQLPPPTEQITLNSNGENGNEQSTTIIRGSRKRKYSPVV